MTDPRDEPVGDGAERLETELAAMRPRPVRHELVDRLAARLDPSTVKGSDAPPRARRWADRMLMTAMSAGAIAACVIAAVLLSELRSANRATQPAAPSMMAANPQEPRFGDATTLLARADVARPE